MGKLSTEHLRIGGMTCVSCQNRIEKALRNTAGVNSVTVRYSGGYANVSYDESVVSAAEIRAVIERLDYTVEKSSTTKTKRTVRLVIIIAALFFLLSQLNLTNSLPLAESGMGYGMLFVIGLLTSVHCVAMCGGICLTQTIGNKLKSSALYNIGRVISYTVVGFIVGALGSVITLDGAFKGVVQVIAGIFMVVMGVNMLGIFPWLRKLTIHFPAFKTNSKSPLIVGLLNGLMPCGPLQAMQIYALSTGSPFKGALAMFLFSLGTVPLMFGLGALSSIMTKKFAQRVMTVGAVFVTVLGLVMFNQGTALSGLSIGNLLPSKTSVSDTMENTVVDGVQLVKSTLQSGTYPKITVQQGTPVKWTIDAPQGSINGCNKSLYIPEYGVEHAFRQGENVIEFTPEKTGKFEYSCWMGMIRGTITVVEQGADTAQKAETVSIKVNVAIPTDKIAVAQIMSRDNDGQPFEYQTVKITLTDSGFSPAVVVVQKGLNVEWVIENQVADSLKAMLRVPLYNAEVPLEQGKNAFSFLPDEDVQFGNGDDTAFGYVKIVDDINSVDETAIKSEVAKFTPTIYPPEQYETAGEQSEASSCH